MHTSVMHSFHTTPLDKVNGNYLEDLARNLQADTVALCRFNKCVLLWTFPRAYVV